MTPHAKAMIFLAASARQIRAQGQNHSQPVASPCMSVCQMDEETALCQGCLRTLDEIRLWGNADDAFKRGVWSDIEARVARYSA
jgi:uncharacterized protein